MIETLVVVTIFSVVALGIGTTFMSGMKIWDKAKNQSFGRTEFILDLEMIAADLRQAVSVPAIGFQGSSSGITFPAISGNSVYKVNYAFDPGKKELLRKQIDIRYMNSTKDQQEGKYKEKDLTGWEEFSLSYLRYDQGKEAYVWSGAWSKQDGVFIAVKVEAKFRGEQFVKTVFMPIYEPA